MKKKRAEDSNNFLDIIMNSVHLIFFILSCKCTMNEIITNLNDWYEVLLAILKKKVNFQECQFKNEKNFSKRNGIYYEF